MKYAFNLENYYYVLLVLLVPGQSIQANLLGRQVLCMS
jgi:hypothetical protein